MLVKGDTGLSKWWPFFYSSAYEVIHYENENMANLWNIMIL